ncbi:MAG TPA: helix-hairpin-helix domain-containing protein [Noviherbaspirillum sp.]|nr:helix-hairpin-helix domain-containing protein [Noviherbaspirillum sp.]
MLKKLALAAVAAWMMVGAATAQVDVNKADVVALDGIKGIGPSTSKAILEERGKGGEYKSWSDFESRVKGVGGKKAAALSQAGLTVNGQARPADTKTGDAGAKAATKASPERK